MFAYMCVRCDVIALFMIPPIFIHRTLTKSSGASMSMGFAWLGSVTERMFFDEAVEIDYDRLSDSVHFAEDHHKEERIGRRSSQ